MLSLTCSSMSTTYLNGRWEQMLHLGRRWRRPTLPKLKAEISEGNHGQALKDWKQPVALAESSLKICWYLQVKGASLHGPERYGPLTNNPASSVSPDALTEVKRKGDEGKAGVRLQSDTGVTTGGTHKPLGMEHLLPTLECCCYFWRMNNQLKCKSSAILSEVARTCQDYINEYIEDIFVAPDP